MTAPRSRRAYRRRYRSTSCIAYTVTSGDRGHAGRKGERTSYIAFTVADGGRGHAGRRGEHMSYIVDIVTDGDRGCAGRSGEIRAASEAKVVSADAGCKISAQGAKTPEDRLLNTQERESVTPRLDILRTP